MLERVLYLLGLARRGEGAHAVRPTAALSLTDVERLNADRCRLIDACMDVEEQVSSDALRARLQAALSDVGVESFIADAEIFDPEQHIAVAPVPTDDPERNGRVAATQRQGYREGTAVIRKPEVLVWRSATR